MHPIQYSSRVTSNFKVTIWFQVIIKVHYIVDTLNLKYKYSNGHGITDGAVLTTGSVLKSGIEKVIPNQYMYVSKVVVSNEWLVLGGWEVKPVKKQFYEK